MKKLLIGIGILVVLLLAAAIIVPLVVPVDAYEGRLIALVKQSTGRDLTIGGPVKLSILPALALEASDVALANAPGGHAPQMVRLKQLQVKLALLPLLHGNLAVSQFVLVQPVIALEVDQAGHPNWVFSTTPPGPGAGAATSPAAASSGEAGLSQLSLEDVEISDGQVSYSDARTGKSEALDGINMKLSLPSLDRAFAATGSAVWNGQKVTLSVNADRPRALLTGGESAFGVKVAANPITVSFAGKMTGLPPTKATGEIDLETPSLRDLAKWLGKPIAMSGGGLGPLKIKGTIDTAGTKYSFTNADISLDAITAKGSVTVDTGGARPVLTGQLDVDKLDVNPYLPPESQSTGAAATTGGGGAPAGSAGWSDTPFDVSSLKVADIDFALKAGAILYRKFQIGASALSLQLKDGLLTADLSQMALYQGTGHGKVVVDASGAVPAIDMNFDLAQVQIGPLATAAMGSERISGTGTFDIAVTGRGKSQRELVGALNGKGALNLVNGQIKGVNFLAMAENAVKSLGGGAGGDTTDFGTLSATYTITNGLLRNTDLQLKSGAVPMTGSGTVNLPTRQVDFHVTPQLPGGIGVPIVVTGPWDNLSYRPDLSGMLQGAAQDPGKLLNTLKSGGESTGSGAGGLLKGLFGK